MVAHGTFWWKELMTRDVAAAKAFGDKALGWTYEDMPMPDGSTYTIVKAGEATAGGILDIAAPSFESVEEGWFAYIAVDDVDARIAAVEAAGVTVAQPPFDVAGVGRIAIVRQPGGAVVGLVTPEAGAGG